MVSSPLDVTLASSDCCNSQHRLLCPSWSISPVNYQRDVLGREILLQSPFACTASQRRSSHLFGMAGGTVEELDAQHRCVAATLGEGEG
jgi:hypothetical protein